ncbi:hypothetical protein [Candidatus Mesenet endosymbiont of Phosphuga atrata]|uniref:hypothetical protein n=1 Tax=Candidatus Mesenet endosymbiont of Phosphuga atrata TaxID=3066221 RepID=UPI0030CCF5A8
MAESRVNITFGLETSQHLIELAEATKQSVQELTEKLVKEAVELEMEDILLSKIANERDVDGAETVNYKDVKWRC